VALFTNSLTAAQIQTLYNFSGVPPLITRQPRSGAVNLNDAFTNTVTAMGSITGYQWYENGTPLSGQTNASLILTSAEAGDDSTNYYVVVSNGYTSVTSAVVSLTVNSAPAVISQTPTNIEIFAGSSPTLFISAAGTGSLQYQWTSNGDVIIGATNSSYTIINPQTATTYGGEIVITGSVKYFTLRRSERVLHGSSV
jgi:hypothetical protein